MSDWYFLRDGGQFGPMPWEEIWRRGQSGELRPSDLVWKDGMPEWRVAASVPNLFPASQPAPSCSRRWRNDWRTPSAASCRIGRARFARRSPLDSARSPSNCTFRHSCSNVLLSSPGNRVSEVRSQLGMACERARIGRSLRW